MLCVLMVEAMSVVVNVMLSLMSMMSPPPALCHLSVRTVVMFCTFGVCFRGELAFLYCDDICMCVINRQFGLREFFYSVYVDLQYMRFISFLLLGLCDVCSRTVCEIVLVSYVDAVTVMRVLLFVLRGWGDGGCVFLGSAGHVGGTRGASIVSSAADVLGNGGVGGLCGMCLGRGVVGEMVVSG